MNDFISGMLSSCTSRLGDFAVAKVGIRALCVHFGGQQVYIPRYKMEESKSAEEIRGVLFDAVGDADGFKMMECIMESFGGAMLYFPFEETAFRSDVAAEIAEKYNGTKACLDEICREYKISFMKVYRLIHFHNAEKKQLQLKF